MKLKASLIFCTALFSGSIWANSEKAVQEAENNLDKWVKDQQAYMADPKNRQELQKKRKELKIAKYLEDITACLRFNLWQ